MCDYNNTIMGSSSPFFNNHLQSSSPVSHQLEVQNQCIGGLSPVNDSSYGSHSGLATPPSRNGSQYTTGCLDSFTQSDCLLSSAAHTLNNYGAEAYNNFDLFDSMSMIPVEPKPEPRQSNSPYNSDTVYESLYLGCTPTGTPLPDSSDSILPDEPALQSLQSLQDLTLDSSFSSNDLQGHSNSLYPVNFDESLVQPQSSMSRQATHLSVNSFNNQPTWQGNNSYDHSSNIWPSSQHNSGNYSHVTSDSSFDHNLLNEDPLNIPCEQLLPQVKNCNIQQLISNAELSGSNAVPDISTPSPSIVTDPRLWTKDDIRTWLTWARKEFNLTGNITVDMLPPTGAELCSLSKQQLQQRVGDSDGENLARYLDCILNSRGASLPEDAPFVNPYEKYSSSCMRLSCPGSGQIQLWQFLLELLSDRNNESIITWENANSEFKILEPDEVARRWGDRKTKPNMNYDKLSRALRYYYDRGLMTKVAGKRYAYKVNFPSLEQLHASQQGSEPKPSPDFALISALSGAPSPTPTWCSSDTPSPRPPYC